MPFGTIDDAAAAALFAVLASHPDADRREFMSAIVPAPGGFSYVQPERGGHTTNRAMGLLRSATTRATVPGNSVALYHNHPSGRTLTFSDDDMNTSERTGLTSYIAALRSSRASPIEAGLRKFIPGQSDSEGEPVLAQIPIEQIRHYLMRKLLDRAPDDARGLMR